MLKCDFHDYENMIENMMNFLFVILAWIKPIVYTILVFVHAKMA
jgi:hypothetical protein